MRFRDDKIDSIGFQIKGDDIILYMACVRKYEDSVVMYTIPERMHTHELMDEICENAINMTYDEVIEAIKEAKNNGADYNVVWKYRGQVIFTYYEPTSVTYRD